MEESNLQALSTKKRSLLLRRATLSKDTIGDGWWSTPQHHPLTLSVSFPSSLSRCAFSSSLLYSPFPNNCRYSFHRQHNPFLLLSLSCLSQAVPPSLPQPPPLIAWLACTLYGLRCISSFIYVHIAFWVFYVCQQLSMDSAANSLVVDSLTVNKQIRVKNSSCKFKALIPFCSISSSCLFHL